jgi:hypothetical protein
MDHNVSKCFPPIRLTDVFHQIRNNQFDKEGYIIFHVFRNIQQTFGPCASPNNRKEVLFGSNFFASEFQARHLDLRPSTNDENIQKRISFCPLLISVQIHIADLVQISGEALGKV